MQKAGNYDEPNEQAAESDDFLFKKEVKYQEQSASFLKDKKSEKKKDVFQVPGDDSHDDDEADNSHNLIEDEDQLIDQNADIDFEFLKKQLSD